MPGTLATLESAATKPPVLHEGETTQAILRQFEIAFKNYVSYKSLDAAAQAAILVGCFRDYRITDWLEIDSERDAALLMTTKQIMAKVRTLVLSPSWERDLRVSMNQRKQSKTEPFSEFATSVRSTNSLLINTDSHVDDARIRTLLEAGMLSDLQEDYEDDPDAKKEKDFRLWLVEVERVDVKCMRANGRLRAIADEQRKAFDAAHKRNATSEHSGDRPPKKTRNENAPPAASSSSSTTDGKHCPKLTAEETQLLNENHGCRKCRAPFVTHATDAVKTCAFPAAVGYQPVTASTVAAA
ncbi:hypothetical protein C8R46DRAFT_889740, partial [Mycena filopes]